MVIFRRLNQIKELFFSYISDKVVLCLHIRYHLSNRAKSLREKLVLFPFIFQREGMREKVALC